MEPNGMRFGSSKMNGPLAFFLRAGDLARAAGLRAGLAARFGAGERAAGGHHLATFGAAAMSAVLSDLRNVLAQVA